jgi:nucleoid DNA-binding protein
MRKRNPRLFKNDAVASLLVGKVFDELTFLLLDGHVSISRFGIFHCTVHSQRSKWNERIATYANGPIKKPKFRPSAYLKEAFIHYRDTKAKMDANTLAVDYGEF